MVICEVGKRKRKKKGWEREEERGKEKDRCHSKHLAPLTIDNSSKYRSLIYLLERLMSFKKH